VTSIRSFSRRTCVLRLMVHLLMTRVHSLRDKFWKRVDKSECPVTLKKGEGHGVPSLNIGQFQWRSERKNKHQPLFGWCCGGNDRNSLPRSGRRDSDPRPSPWQVIVLVCRWSGSSFPITTVLLLVLQYEKTKLSRSRFCSVGNY
jgi:hypothetical protein